MKTRKGYLEKRGGTYYAVWTIAGKKYIKTTRCTTEREARKALTKIMEPFMIEDENQTLKNIAAKIQQNRGDLVTFDESKNPPLTLATAWTEFLKQSSSLEAGKATLGVYELTWGRFTTWMKEHQGDAKLMRDVTPELAREFANNIRGSRSNGTYNKYVRLLDCVFKTLLKKSKLEGSPFHTVPRISNKKAIRHGRRELTDDEMKLIGAAAKDDLSILIALGYYTGLRLGDCATLKWDEADLTGGWIKRIPNKGAIIDPNTGEKTPLRIEIHPHLIAILRSIPVNEHGEFVLPRIASDYNRHSSYVTNRIQQLFEGCGIKTLKKVEGRKNSAVEVGFHSLRHSFVSRCARLGVPLPVVQSIVGHSNPAMTRHYTHVRDEDKRILNSLPSIMGDTKALPPAQSPRLVDAGAIRKVVEELNGKNWKIVRDELFKLLGDQQEGSL